MSAANAIWLCSACADLIDKDSESYPVALLEAWKRSAEAAAGSQALAPMPPYVSVVSHGGVGPTHAGAGSYMDDAEGLREYSFIVENKGDRALLRLRLRFQLPELVAFSAGIEVSWPIGCQVECGLEDRSWTVAPGTTFSPSRARIEHGRVFVVTMSELPPWTRAIIKVRSKPDTEVASVRRIAEHVDAKKAHFFIQAEWNWQWNGRTRKDRERFILKYDALREIDVWREAAHREFAAEFLVPIFGTLSAAPGKQIGFTVWPNA